MNKRKKFIFCIESIILGAVIFYLCSMSWPMEKPLCYLAIVVSFVFSVSLGYYVYSCRVALAEAMEVVNAALFGKKISVLTKKGLIQRLAKEYFHGSVNNLVFALDGNEKISEEEAQEVLDYLEKL